MATNTYTPIRGKKIRVTQLDDCGRLLETSEFIVTDGFVTLTLSPEVEDGTEITSRKANGGLCVNELGNPTFKHFNLEIDFCDVNPSLIPFVTNAEEYENYEGDVAGFTIPEGEITGNFALELWTGMAGVACGDDGNEASGYILLPFVRAGTLGDLEIGGEDVITFSLTNSITRGGNSWGQGPYEVVLNDDEGGAEADILPTPLDPLDHLLMVETFVSPPEEQLSPVVVTI